MSALSIRAPWSVLDSIGDTPLVELKRLAPSRRARIFAKLERFNPGGSVKDRPALAMIEDAESRGLLTPGRAILDATSGNTGISYAMIGASKGYRVVLTLPANINTERYRILNAYGARLVLTDPLDGAEGAVREARRLKEESPESYYYADQYNNDANWRAHYRTTAEEIWRDLGHELTHFVAGRGTSGTFVGTARRLKERNPDIEAITYSPDSPMHGLEGIKHFPTSTVPGIFDGSLVDGDVEVSTEDSHAMVRRLAREEGLFVGISSGAAMVTALRVAEDLRQGSIAVIFPDGGSRYLSEDFWGQPQTDPEDHPHAPRNVPPTTGVYPHTGRTK